MIRIFARLGVVAAIVLAGCASQPAAPVHSTEPPHLAIAHQLLKEAAPENVSYQHRPTVVVLENDDAEPARVHADCSGLVNSVLERGYGLTDAQLTEILSAKRPLAKHYAKAIELEHGFARIRHVANLRPGDVLASPYATESGNTGHVMIVDGMPRLQQTDFTPAGLERYVIQILDSTSSGHGAPDSRVGPDGRALHTGLGTGMIALYCKSGEIAGYSWGTSRSSRIWMLTERPLLAGRFGMRTK